MRLEGLEVFAVAPPPPGWGGRWWTLARLTAEDGTRGWGECYLTGLGPAAARAVVEDVFRRHMQGTSAEDVELMFRRVHSSGFTQRPDPTLMGAFSGLEIACWDILGKARGRPIWALLGGRVNERLRTYTYLYPLPHHDPGGFWTSPEMAAESAAACVEAGFTAVKFDPAGPYTIRSGHMPAMTDITRSAAFCAAVRETVRDRADLLFGTHGQFSVGGAIRLAQAIARYQPLWFEEPVPPDQADALARVARATHIPVAAGERLTTRWEFAAALDAGVAIVQPATGRAGGLWETRKIGAVAETRGAEVAPHLYAGPVEWAANVQLAATLPNLSMVETIGTCGGIEDDPVGRFHGDLIGHAIRWDDGFVLPPDAPGLGIDVDEALLAAHAYTGDRLHLEMQEAPCDWRNGNDFRGGGADPAAPDWDSRKPR